MQQVRVEGQVEDDLYPVVSRALRPDCCLNPHLSEPKLSALEVHRLHFLDVVCPLVQPATQDGRFSLECKPSQLDLSTPRGGDEWRGRLHEMNAPLLVIHGTADPVYPIAHGVALADAVAGAKQVRLDGGGHELHRAAWYPIIDAIVAHTAQGV